MAVLGLFVLVAVFQFHTGSIKRIRLGHLIPEHRRFNSILVRLKVRTQGITEAELVFQFHTGSIKSQGTRCRSSRDYVSIPYWFD